MLKSISYSVIQLVLLRELIISQKKFDEIRNILVQLQHDNGIEIIFAIESGSRLRGISSKDSDYDIRFVYKRPISQYLKIIEDTRDTIEILNDEIDIVGWDISKFLSLLYKSNPSALEWLKADIIYLGDKSELEKYTEYVSPKKLYFHYRSLSFNQYVRYIESKEKAVLKKYLYLMRGILKIGRASCRERV